MPQNTHVESAEASERFFDSVDQDGAHDAELIAARAAECARSLIWLPEARTSPHFAERLQTLASELGKLVTALQRPSPNQIGGSEEWRWLRDNIHLLRSVTAKLPEVERMLASLPKVARDNGEIVPRAVAIAENLFSVLADRFVDSDVNTYLRAFQSVTVLPLRELQVLPAAFNLVLLERIAIVFRLLMANQEAKGTRTCIRSLRDIAQAPWRELLEPLIVFDQVLRQDPAGAYAHMDVDTREMYRRAVVHLAAHSDCSELEIARQSLALARESQRNREPDLRRALRRSHVGYYLVAEGRKLLYRRAHVRLPWHERLEEFLHRYADELYLSGIEVLTFVIVIAIIWRGIEVYSLSAIFFCVLVLLLPSSQSAVEVMNYLVTSLLAPRTLPKMDFQNGIPDDCLTMVVVPTLLLTEEQVRRLVNDLEVRYVGNMSANLHFALLTDLPDSTSTPEEDDPLVHLCGELIRRLNDKYRGNSAGRFAMFHRHRVYNPREGVWMGWERKRGKLLDFNKLILGDYDSFPYKAGEFSILRRVRYVLTLDSDTELPRGTAHRLIGALAHPLCQAIIDPERNIVVEGFGILQPRVGVSVQSAAQSRLASIYSGQTGFDIYTRAISDVYQDLYGEGTFVGKGLYEVRTLHKVLDHRFPRNALLSHDLIEGAYARVGFVSDVQVIDDYPSHYRAYIRRKHRWLRGDWQIVEWLFPRVPDESGNRVPNPISFISRWKILDNLRRSLIEIAIFVFLVLGWTVLPGRPLFWTAVTLAILFVPPWVQFACGVVRAALSASLGGIADAMASLGTALVSVVLTLTFLQHNVLVAVDAIARTMYRRMVSRRRMLEWETAEEAELGKQKRTPADWYLISMPAVALGIGVLVGFVHRQALAAALPILLLWAGSKLISLWLDRPFPSARNTYSRKDRQFLRRLALRTWRYFAEFSTEEHNWLVPDNVQEQALKIAPRISPTNLAVLLNARQVACQMGYLTVPEFAWQTRKTLETMARMQTYRGHLLNWYDTRTLSPLAPRFVSTVDSGNLAAALVALKNGTAALLDKPLLSPALADGYDDFVGVLTELPVVSRKTLRVLRQQQKMPWLERLLAPAHSATSGDRSAKDAPSWFETQLTARHECNRKLIADYMPWLLPQFESLDHDPAFACLKGMHEVSLARLPAAIELLSTRLEDIAAGNSFSADMQYCCRQLSQLLQAAHQNSTRLISELQSLAEDAGGWFSGMDFAFLLDRRRKLLSIGFDVESGTLHQACYDLLASESRIATFVAIAKGDVPQEIWFQLGRGYVLAGGQPILASWTGTMFEYLMPAIWMRSYPDTLLRRSAEGAVRVQQLYAARKGVPWGISESAYNCFDESGNYGYRAFGIPQLALQKEDSKTLAVAPYASILAVGFDSEAALANLRWMMKRGWLGAYGFYEAADFTRVRGRSRWRRFELVKSWMAHHEGMSLLSIANVLENGVVQRWFHGDPRVQSTELLLHERPIVKKRAAPLLRWPSLSFRNGSKREKKIA
ncbi:MAG: glucoamylase family protein [Candidatus Korobacteraceae bacterium]